MLVLLGVISESADYIAEAKKSLVNADALFHQLADSASTLDPFGARKINEVELGSNLLLLLTRKACLQFGLAIRHVDLFNDSLLNRYGKDGMRT